MDFNIDIQDVLIFSIAQMLLVLFILLGKKYRVLPNLFLGLIIGLLIIHFIYFFLEINGFFNLHPAIHLLLKPILVLPPIIVYILFCAKDTQNQKPRKMFMVKHAVPTELFSFIDLPNQGTYVPRYNMSSLMGLFNFSL